jgi:hypothetical protein
LFGKPSGRKNKMATAGYNFYKKTCDKCGISKANAPVVKTGLQWPYEYSNSFQLGHDGSVLCYQCHKEQSLQNLFEALSVRKLTQEATNRI